MKAELTLPPELVDEIVDRFIEKINPLISSNGKQEDCIFDKKTLSEYLGVDVSWIDKRVSQKEIPFFKAGKYVKFKKSAIDKWIDGIMIKPFNSCELVKSSR